LIGDGTKWRTLHIIPILRLIFEQITCDFQLRWLSIIMPKYLIWYSCFNGLLSILSDRVCDIFFWTGLYLRSCHFLYKYSWRLFISKPYKVITLHPLPLLKWLNPLDFHMTKYLCNQYTRHQHRICDCGIQRKHFPSHCENSCVVRSLYQYISCRTTRLY